MTLVSAVDLALRGLRRAVGLLSTVLRTVLKAYDCRTPFLTRSALAIAMSCKQQRCFSGL